MSAHTPRARPGFARSLAGGLALLWTLSATALGGEVVGRLTDEAGRAIEGARVLAAAETRPLPLDAELAREVHEAVSDEFGEFVLRDVAPGPIRFAVRASGLLDLDRTDLRVPGGAARFDLGEFVVPRGTPSILRVESSGQPLPGARVLALADDAPAHAGAPWARPLGVTGADGELHIDRLVPGVHTLIVTAEGHAALRADVWLTGSRGAPARVALTHGFTLSYRIFPVPDEPVDLWLIPLEALAAEDVTTAFDVRRVRLDSTGAWLAEGLRPAELMLLRLAGDLPLAEDAWSRPVWFTGPGSGTASDESQAPHPVRLPSAVIALRVRTHREEELPLEARVRVLGTTDEGWRTISLEGRDLRIGGLRPRPARARIDLDVDLGDGRTLRFEDVKLAPGGVTDLGEWRLPDRRIPEPETTRGAPEPTGELRVRVVDEYGEPTAGIRVLAARSGADGMLEPALLRVTPASGDAVFSTIPAGRWLVSLERSPDQVLPHEWDTVEVRAGDWIERTFGRERSSLLRARIMIGDQPLAGGLVQLPGGGRARTDLDGGLFVRDLSPGTVLLAIRPAGAPLDHYARLVVPAADAAERTRQPLTLEVASIAGVVTDTSGAHVAGARLHVSDGISQAAPPKLRPGVTHVAELIDAVRAAAPSAVTDEAGRFVLERLPAIGALTITATDDSGRCGSSRVRGLERDARVVDACVVLSATARLSVYSALDAPPEVAAARTGRGRALLLACEGRYSAGSGPRLAWPAFERDVAGYPVARTFEGLAPGRWTLLELGLDELGTVASARELERFTVRGDEHLEMTLE